MNAPKRQPYRLVFKLTRTVAVAMGDELLVRPGLVDAILARGDLTNYHRAHSVWADFCCWLRRTAKARVSYEGALSLMQQEPVRRFLDDEGQK
ncbi:MAG: hypothetical protein OJF52_002919 [Nitrospira sp.]|nr:MAG: hypothetical protein OJF52_002919 [Nitrospira sp.]